MQTTDEPEYPFYIKAPLVLIGLFLFFYILALMSSVLIPFAFAGLIAILLNPLFNRLDRKLPRIIAIVLTLLIALAVMAGLFYFLSSQIANFGKSLPALKEKTTMLLSELQTWIQLRFGVSVEKQVAGIKSEVTGGGGMTMLTNTLGTVLGLVSVLILLPIYVFLLLFYKPLILDFLFQVFSEKYSLRVAEILGQTKSAIQSFMIGLMTETAIVCTLNSIALLIIGVPNAIIIGVIGGLLNILPYIGGVIAIALPVIMSLITTDSFSPLLAIVGAYILIQFIDNNFLVPRIVSSKVKINALISIVIVLLGNLLWGIPGMFLSIPFIAVLKIIFDRVDGLKPWGRLLGDEVPTEHIGVEWQKRWSRILRRVETKKAIQENSDEK
ncbi:MAG TPA: AI-2E family transporter [Chitinophagaceae bacterium]|nr:AI-2E family transporter [Chitinophagaceae bacterium]